MINAIVELGLSSFSVSFDTFVKFHQSARFIVASLQRDSYVKNAIKWHAGQ